MKSKYGFTPNEIAKASKQTWTKADDNLIRVMKSESDCTAWVYPFYAVDKKGKYVLGLEDEEETDSYCEENGYIKMTLDQACFNNNKPNKYKNWTDTYPTEGLLQ